MIPIRDINQTRRTPVVTWSLIGANLLVERDSQKRIVVGRGGSMIKKIGIRSRGSLERWLDSKVHLELFVKIDPSWLKNVKRIEELGYN